MSRRIALTSVILIVINVVVAATGYLRELVLARTFGAGTEMDAFYFTWALVLATHDLLFGATLTATIVPLLHKRDDSAAAAVHNPARFTVTVAILVAVLASALALAMSAALPYLIVILSPDMPATVRAQCIVLGTVLVWLLPLNALMNVFLLVLNAHQRFILGALVYFIINFVFIVGVLLIEPIAGANSLSIASLAGPIIVIPILVVSLAQIGSVRAVSPDLSRKFFAPLWRQARPILLTFGIGSSLGLLMVAHLIVRGFAGDSGTGSIAALGYAFRLYELPLSLLANPAATLMLPSIAILYGAGRTAEIADISRQILLAGLVVLFPAAMVTWAGADLIVHVFLERGNFGKEAALLTSDALRGFAPAIVGEGIIVVFYRLFYAIHKPNRAVIASCAALLTLGILLALFGNSSFVAIPLALSGGFSLGAIMLVYFLLRDIGVGAVPSAGALLKWIISALVGLAAWKIAERYQTANVWTQLFGVTSFTVIYFSAILTLFSDYRRSLLRLASEFTSRLGS